jgi:hypothetical protein
MFIDVLAPIEITKGPSMYYSEASIAALHRARTERLHAAAEPRARKSRGLGLRFLASRGHKARVPARTAQAVHSG